MPTQQPLATPALTSDRPAAATGGGWPGESSAGLDLLPAGHTAGRLALYEPCRRPFARGHARPGAGTRLCIPLVEEPSEARTHRLDFDPVDITFLPPLASVISSQRYFFRTRRVIRRFARSVDVLFMRSPFQVPTALRRLGKPKLMHIVSNQQTVIEASSDYGPIMKQLARRFAGHSLATMRRCVPSRTRTSPRTARKCTTCCDRVLAGWWSRRASTNARCGRARRWALAIRRGCCSWATCGPRKASTRCSMPSTACTAGDR